MTFINTGAIVALYISIFIITKKTRKGEDYILFIYFILNSLIFTTVSIAYSFNEPDLLFFIINIDMLTTPIWYLYIGGLANYKSLSVKRALKHLFPYFLTLIILIVYSELVGAKEFEGIIELSLLEQPLILSLITLWEFLVVPFYIVLSLRALKEHSKSIKEFYSYKKGVDLIWVNLFISLHFLGWITLYTLYWLNIENSLMVGISINGFLILYLGYFGIKENRDLNTQEKYSKSYMELSSVENYKNRVEAVLNSDKPYLDSELTLLKLSDLTNIPTHKLSQVFSQGFKMSFYELVNSYRIEEFKRRALDPQNSNYTLLSIAMDSGFNSKSSFNRIFKERVKVTPREFLAQAMAV